VPALFFEHYFFEHIFLKKIDSNCSLITTILTADDLMAQYIVGQEIADNLSKINENLSELEPTLQIPTATGIPADEPSTPL
jgi:hypothetical protein